MRILLTAVLLAAALGAQDSNGPANRIKANTASKAHPATVGDAMLWHDPAEWTWVESGSEGVQTFLFLKREAQARWISKDEGGDPQEVLEATLAGIQKLDHEAKSVFNERRRVNGADILCVQIRASKGDADVVYFGYIYADEERTHQLYTVSSGWTLSKHYSDFEKFLDGLVVVGPDSTLGQ